VARGAGVRLTALSNERVRALTEEVATSSFVSFRLSCRLSPCVGLKGVGGQARAISTAAVALHMQGGEKSGSQSQQHLRKAPLIDAPAGRHWRP